jgi:prefoldin subunit 5
MKVLLRSILALAISSVALAPLALAQTSYPPASQQNPAASEPSAASTPANSGDLGMLLSRIEQEATGLNADVGKLRIEKWKADSASKYQATENAASIQRSITSALPALIGAVRSAPQSLASNFKLYRTINALYDVLASLGESAGAFGKREECETLAPHIAALDESRRAYGDLLQQLTATADNRLASAQQQAQAAAQAPPKKIIVDDSEPVPAPPHKKSKPKKPANSSSAATSSPK